MDADLKGILLESEATHWKEGDRINRLAELLRERGVAVKELKAVELSAPYVATKDLFGPKEILHIRIEKGVAYLEVVKEKIRQD
jgi:hypothetical protein